MRKHKLTSKEIARSMMEDADRIEYKFTDGYGYTSCIVEVYGHRYKIDGIHTENPVIIQVDCV